jgi:hypothetical protein
MICGRESRIVCRVSAERPVAGGIDDERRRCEIALLKGRMQFTCDVARNERENLRYQIDTASAGHGRRRNLLYVFTEHGAIMAANVLNSRRAVQMSVFVVRAFLKMRALLGDKGDLAQKLASLEKELKKRLDVQEAVTVTILQRVMDIIDLQ